MLVSSIRQMIASVGVLMLGTVAAQAVSFIATPILSRLFSPDSFGQYGLFMASITMLASISCGRLELAISLPKHERASKNIAAAARSLALGVSLIALLLLGFTLGLIKALWDGFEATLWLLAIPPIALLIAWNGTYAQQNLRALQFPLQARLRFLQSALYVAFAALLGWAGFLSSGLIIATFLTQVFICVLHCRRTGWVLSAPARATVVVRRYSDFPTKQVPATLIETGTAYLPILFIAPQFGSTVAGYFFFAQTVLRQPVAFISNAIGEIYRQWLSRRVADGLSAQRGTIRTVLILGIASFAIFMPFVVTAHWLVPLLFGKEWSGSVVYFQIFSLITAFQFIASPISPAFFILSRQTWDVILQVGTAAALLITLSLASWFNLSAIVSILTFAFVYIVRYSIQLFVSIRLIVGRRCA